MSSLLNWLTRKETSSSSQPPVSESIISKDIRTIEVELDTDTLNTESASASCATERAEILTLESSYHLTAQTAVSKSVSESVALSCDSDVEIFDTESESNQEASSSVKSNSSSSTSKDRAHKKVGKFNQKKKSTKTNNEPYKQRFRDQWLTDPECSGWLEKRITGINKEPVAYCTSCSEYFTGGTGLSELKRHKATSKHERSAHLITLIEAQRKQIAEACSNPQDNNVVVLATRMCIFLAENNLSLSLIDKLIPLLRCCFPNDECLRKLKLAKQKTSNIIRFN